MRFTTAAKRAIQNYGRETCIAIHTEYDQSGEGAATLSGSFKTLAGKSMTTRQADAAIEAGRQIAWGFGK